MRGTASHCMFVEDSCGARKLFVNVATIRSDAFWFSAVRQCGPRVPDFHGSNAGSNPAGDAK